MYVCMYYCKIDGLPVVPALASSIVSCLLLAGGRIPCWRSSEVMGAGFTYRLSLYWYRVALSANGC